MSDYKVKFGVVSCSGEDCAGGTIARLATRTILDEVRPDHTVTICLSLFLAGGAKEREFANTYPTITVDGCDKACGRRAVEKYSGTVMVGTIVSDIIGREAAGAKVLSTRQLMPEHQGMIDKVVADITCKVDTLLDMFNKIKAQNSQDECCSGGCTCGCGGGGATNSLTCGSSKAEAAVCVELIDNAPVANTIIYTKNGCPFCAQVVAEYQAKGIEFTEVNTSLDLAAKKMCKDTYGVSTVPFIVRDGSVVQIGDAAGHG